MKSHGFIIVNEFKEQDSHPDYFGIITIGGSEYTIGGWDGKTKKGIAKISLRCALRKRQTVQEKIDASKGDEPMD